MAQTVDYTGCEYALGWFVLPLTLRNMEGWMNDRAREGFIIERIMDVDDDAVLVIMFQAK